MKPKKAKTESKALPKPKWPIEDAELFFYIKPTSHPEMASSAVPAPMRQFSVSQGISKII
jgi:hypothetical protein